MAYLISYNPSYHRSREQFLGAIKSFPSWAIINDDTFIIQVEGMNSEQIRNSLMRFCKLGDKLLVLSLDGEAAWRGLNNNVSNWIKNNI